VYVLDREWTDGFLDYALMPGHTRIKVALWQTVDQVTDAYIQRPRDLRLVWNYLREIGPRAVYAKVRSRSAERLRNAKYISCGIGMVMENSDTFTKGDVVVFIAPIHPRCVDVVALANDLVLYLDQGIIGDWQAEPGVILHGGEAHQVLSPDLLQRARRYAGWTAESGTCLDLLDLQSTLGQIAPTLISGSRPRRRLPDRPIQECQAPTAGVPNTEKTAILFGLGNYSKATILPNLDAQLGVATIHEIDPTQLEPSAVNGCAIDTSPLPRPGEMPDAFFIASYHHTHADLAVQALQQGAYAVVEKPVATTRDQLDRLETAMVKAPGKVVACFHKRYHRFNQWLRQDLDMQPGEPVSCYCIVYEIPLPRLHWYNWPASGSRLISNGCHWIDHFLFLNDFSEPVDKSVWQGADGSLLVGLELANGACLTLTLTDQGSDRIGVQEHVEFRANGVTVTIDNGSKYVAESSRRIIRRGHVNKLAVYGDMYREVSRRIAQGLPGDSDQSIVISTRAILDLEDELRVIAGPPDGKQLAGQKKGNHETGRPVVPER
jgi:predicted dehydrogenase